MDDAAVRDEVTDLLRALIRIDTSNPPGRETPAAMEIARYLESAGVEVELVARDPDRANLIARIRGTGDGPSLCFLGHTDVVPADAGDWTHPPFSGHLDEDGFVWGRGTADMKSAHIACDFAIDEGGGWRIELPDGRVAVSICVGEKATLQARVTALGEAGHASNPELGANAVLRLATLVERLGAHRTERVVHPAARRMYEALGVSLDDGVDVAIERLAALSPLLAEDAPPLFGTTIAPTRLRGSAALNVIPARASVECDCRLLPGTTAADLERELRAALGDDIPYELELVGSPIGGSSSPLDTPLYRACQDFLDDRDPGAKVFPILLGGFCDMHFLREAFGTVAYGFWPQRYTPLEVYFDGVHNRDERIHVDDLVYAVRFHLHVAQSMSLLP